MIRTQNKGFYMKIAIVDDELIFAQFFRNIIEKKFDDKIQMLDIFTTVRSFISAENKFDLIFLDIDMPEISGLEFAKKHSDLSSRIIFVTNRDDLVFEAFNTTQTLGFVRKSKLEEDLSIVLDRLHREAQCSMFFTVKCGSSIRKVKFSEIIYVEKVSHNVIIHTSTDDITMRKTIAEIESLLINNGFIRTHVGYIVNMTHIKLIDTKDVKLSNGNSVPISRQNVKSIKDKFLKWSVMLNE